MFKNVSTLAILTHIVYIVGATNNATEPTCNYQCRIICEACHTCADDELDCGLDDSDPTFGHVCSLTKSICVAKNCTCKYIIIDM